GLTLSSTYGQIPENVQKWLGPQDWQRDADEPVLSLGEPGEFDDAHLISPRVVKHQGKYMMWYSGSRGFAYDVAPTRHPDERVYQLGLATSPDGIRFTKQAEPRIKLPDEKRSFLTPTLLQNPDGTLLKFNGKYWMW